jgi:ATP adenylyltransferase/5',5'''-P-1,P-4-tetraphosphate phosphorylase II
MHNAQDCCRYEKSGNKKSNYRATKKGAKKPYPTKQSFAQLCEKMDKLEKVIKKQEAKRKKRRRSDTDSNSE